jgi:hypothetical protein
MREDLLLISVVPLSLKSKEARSEKSLYSPVLEAEHTSV